MQAFEVEMQAKAQAKQAEDAKKFEAAKAEGEKFLAENESAKE